MMHPEQNPNNLDMPLDKASLENHCNLGFHLDFLLGLDPQLE
jgi:hypothetical protein